MFGIVSVVQSDGLSAGDVLGSIPHDAAAIVVYILVLGFAGFVWHGSRKKS